MRHSSDNGDLVLYRGPVSGSGEALSDEDALAILDERVEPSQGEVPDIGVVIDPEQSQRSESAAQQELPLGGKEDWASVTGVVAWKGQGPEDWSSLRRLFEPEVPRCIVKTGELETPLSMLLDQSCGFGAPRGERLTFDTPIILRILSRNSVIDLALSPEDCRRSDLTISDLLAKGITSQHGVRIEKA